MNNFNWEEFDNGIIAVYCKTKERAEGFLGKAHNEGYIWRSGASLLEVNYFEEEENIAYYIWGGSFGFNSLEEAERWCSKIIKWEVKESEDKDNE